MYLEIKRDHFDNIIKDMKNNLNNNYELIEKEEEGFLLVSKKLKTHESRLVYGVIFFDDNIVRIGEEITPCFVDLSDSQKQEEARYFCNDLFGYSLEELEEDRSLAVNNYNLYAEIAFYKIIENNGVNFKIID